MKDLTVGQVANRTGVGVETVWLYERQGLLAEPDRKESGYRMRRERNRGIVYALPVHFRLR